MKKKKKIRTIQKSCFWEICMVLCIMLLLPINLSVLFVQDNREGNGKEKETMLSTELEWKVLHMLAAVIPVSCEEETLKAQAVIIRTNILADEEEGKETERMPLLFSYKKEWRENYEENCKKLVRAVEETKGIYLEKDKKIMRTPYFYLSNGSTREGKECMGEEYSQFKAKQCLKDLTNENFVKKEIIKGEKFAEKIGEEAGREISFEQLKEAEITYQNDSAGYVLQVEIGEICLGGEVFRRIFSLPSSDFSITFEQEEVTVKTKGVGTGIGFCQYSANEMAKEGSDYLELLQFFLTNIAISKTE